jgi:hypothetical protein
MYTDKELEQNIIIELDISEIDEDDYLGDGWALIHLTPDGEYIKGLHYVEDPEDIYTDYIPDNDINDNDMIMLGKIEGKILKVTNLIK